MTLLFVPGFMADRSLWDELIEALGASDVAFGELDKGESIEDMAQRVLHSAPARFDLVSFSMGGYVARAMARRAPERVRSLILIATSARADTERQAQAKAAAVAQMRSSAVFRGLSRASVLASLHPMHANNDALIERVQAMGVRLGRDVFIRQSSMERNSDLDRLSEIRCPTLIIAAHDDGLRSLEEARELQLGIHDAEVVVIEDSGHMLPMEAPEAVGAAITSWLARHPPAST